MEISRLRLPLASAALLCPLLCADPSLAQSATGNLIPRDELRVCADPHNMPFSDEQHEGFENKIAELLGRDLSLPVHYVWFPQVIGFVRNTLGARRCDLVIGIVAGDDLMQTTTPYYYTGYVIVYRRDSGWSFSNFDDARLKGKHIGVVAGTPPADLLVHHGLMANARPYALTIDTRYESPTHQMVLDIVNKSIDAGLLWGPIAGYYIRHDKLPLAMAMLKDEPQSPRLYYHIAMGVRHNEPDWRRRINGVIAKDRGAITAILRDYGVPLLDEQGNPLQP
jgi:quinoprotein dehydrogenase-associated probable ABC transporter substrate-binding protein